MGQKNVMGFKHILTSVQKWILTFSSDFFTVQVEVFLSFECLEQKCK